MASAASAATVTVSATGKTQFTRLRGAARKRLLQGRGQFGLPRTLERLEQNPIALNGQITGIAVLHSKAPALVMQNTGVRAFMAHYFPPLAFHNPTVKYVRKIVPEAESQLVLRLADGTEKSYPILSRTKEEILEQVLKVVRAAPEL